MKSTIAKRVKQGMIQDVRVDYNDKGKSTVTPLSDWRPVTQSEIAEMVEKAKQKINAIVNGR